MKITIGPRKVESSDAPFALSVALAALIASGRRCALVAFVLAGLPWLIRLGVDQWRGVGDALDGRPASCRADR